MQSQVQKGGVILFSGMVIEQRSGQPLSMRTNTYLCKECRLAKCPRYENAPGMKMFIALLIRVQYREETVTLKRQV